MKPLSLEEKKTLIGVLPFPIAYLYQQLLAYQSFVQQQKKPDDSFVILGFWALRNNSRLLAKMVGIVALCDYFRSSKEGEENTEKINRFILDYMEDGGEDWLQLARLLISYFQRQRQGGRTNKIPELLNLLDCDIRFSHIPTGPGMPRVSPRKLYHWFEVMEIFQELDKQLYAGDYRFALPSTEVLNCYIALLERALASCKFLHLYELYVLVGKDERKTRGFLCQGIKSQPVGIRGMASIWNAQKRRPFLCRSGQKYFLSCFPFIAPMLQKRGERIAFRDLLVYEYGDMERMFFYAHRLKQFLPHHICAQDALGVWQKQVRWLDAHAAKPTRLHQKIFTFHDLAVYHTRYFTGRTAVFQSIFRALEENRMGYLYLRGRAGYGKTALLGKLYLEKDLSRLSVCWPHQPPLWVWHFCSPLDELDDPALMLQSLYGQILQKVYHMSDESVLSRLQKLPTILENLQRSFEQLLDEAGKEVLRPGRQYLVVVIDGLNEVGQNVPSLPSIASSLPARLPDNVFFFLTWRTRDNADFLLSPLFHEDGISLNHIRSAGTPVIELPDSPLSPLGPEDVSDWVKENAAISEEDQDAVGDLAWQKSGGDPLYLGLLGDACRIGATPGGGGEVTPKWVSVLPQGRYNFFRRMWENLDDKEGFVLYRILGLLAALKECGKEKILAEILEVPPQNVQQHRWMLNHFLRNDGNCFAISHSVLRDYIYRQFRSRDQKDMQQGLLNYYQKVGARDKIDYKILSDVALRKLSHHHYQLGDWQNLYKLAMDNRFKEEKVGRFKVYQSYLYDIALALKCCVEHRQYPETLRLGYRCAQIVGEALQGISHAFRTAAYGDYQLALERIRIIRDEHELFKANLIILWHGIYNGQSKEASPVLDEIRTIADEEIHYLMAGMEPWILFLLKKLRQFDLPRVDYIVGKHGLKRQEAVRYLLDLQQQLHFEGLHLKYFAKKLADSFRELISSKDKVDYLPQVVSLCAEAEKADKTPEMWREIQTAVETIKDLRSKLGAFKILGSAIVSLPHRDYWESYVAAVHDIRTELASVEKNAVHSLQYAVLLQLAGETEEAELMVEEALKEAHASPGADFVSLFVAEMDGKWWDRILTLARAVEDPACQKSVWETIAVAMAKRGDVPGAFQVLEEHGREPLDFGRFQDMVDSLRKQPQAGAVPYWNTLVKQVPLYSAIEQSLALKEVMVGILQLQVPEENPLWDTFISAYAQAEKAEGETEPERILADFASGLARKGYFRKTRHIISILSQSVHRGQCLAEIARYWIENKDEIALALETLIEISELAQQLKVLDDVAGHIPLGDPGRALWKRVTTTLKSMHWENQGSGEWRRHFTGIVEKLMAALPLDESGPLWQDLFWAIHAISSDEAVVEILEKIFAGLGNAPAFEATESFWPLLEESMSRITGNYGRAIVRCAMSATLARLGQIWKANEILDLSWKFAQQEDNPVLALKAMARVMAGYRELGKEGKCHEIFEEILRYSGITEGKKVKHWDPHQFLVQLSDLGLEDFAMLMAEKMLLAVVDSSDEAPPPKDLADLAELFVEAGEDHLLRQIFFRIIPHLAKDEGIGEEVPLYIQVSRLLEKVQDEQSFEELWKHTEEMVLNFPRLGMQERCLEALAGVLMRRGAFEKNRSLWDKLITDATYIGNQLESLRTKIRIGKQSTQIAPRKEVEKNFEEVLIAAAGIQSEYDQVDVIKMLSEMVAYFPQFDSVFSLWDRLVNFAGQCKRKDCQALMLLHLSRVLSRRARNHGEWGLMDEADKLLDQIPKPQQRAEGYLGIAREYLEAARNQECLTVLDKAIKIGKDLGSFYQKKLLPGILDCMIALDQYPSALRMLDELPWDVEKIFLYFTIVERLEVNDPAQAQKLISEILPQIGHISPQYGDQARMYALAAVRAGEIQGIPIAMGLWDKAFGRWDAMVNSSCQKETVSYMVAQLESSGNHPELAPVWQALYAKAKSLEEETYRFWAMQETAAALARLRDFRYIWEVLGILAPGSEAKFHTLAAFAQEAKEEEAIALLQVLNPEEKLVFLKKLAEILEKRGSMDGLFRLWQEMPGNFSLLCHLTTKMLSLALKQKGKQCFLRWFWEIASAWGFAVTR